jgi:hypothetical protein
MTVADERSVPQAVPRRTRWKVSATIAAIILVGVSVGWLLAKYLTAHLAEPEQAASTLPQPGTASVTEPESSSSRLPQAPSAPVAPPPAPLEVQVNSYSGDLAYPLSEWLPGKTPSGFVDVVSVNGTNRPPNVPLDMVGKGDRIGLSGWAGDISVGLRYPYVLISACGLVVAHAVVDRPRPDVAKSIHANLDRSGWALTIAASHLPKCENRTLEAWGVAPGASRIVLPLNNRIAVPGGAVAADESIRLAAVASPIRPADMVAIAPAKLTVHPAKLNMRRCASADCPVTGTLAKGAWEVLTLDKAAGWLLVAMPDRAGWVSDQYVELVDGQR